MKHTIDFQPKLFTALKNYDRRKFTADLMAGIIVGIVALPLAIAFGIASGVSPEKGLITAILGGFIVSFLGGSNVQIGGPTGAFIVIVAGMSCSDSSNSASSSNSSPIPSSWASRLVLP